MNPLKPKDYNSIDITIQHHSPTLIVEFDTFMNEVHAKSLFLGEITKEEVARMKGAFIAGATIMNKKITDIYDIADSLMKVSVHEELLSLIDKEIAKEKEEEQ